MAEYVPSVAELPTCQKIEHDPAPPRTTTLLYEAVTSVDAILKTKIPSGSLVASSVRVPVISKYPARES